MTAYETFLSAVFCGATWHIGVLHIRLRTARLHALEQARQCAIYPPTDTYHPEKRAAYDDVFRRISLLIERAG